MIDRVAFLSMHTSPLDRPGEGDAGGMNVYIDELAGSLSRRGIGVTVFTRRTHSAQTEVTTTPAGYEVVQVQAGPTAPVPLADQVEWVGDFADRVTKAVVDPTTGEMQFDLIHSHYWLSGWTGLLVKEATGLPLANSFHTLGRIKDATRRPGQPGEPLNRIAAEREGIAHADCVIASTEYESWELIDLYGADPGRVCVNPPGIDLTLFKPGDRQAARRALGLDDVPTVLFVGRIQALKGLDVAVEAFKTVNDYLPDAQMLVVGGPSGPSGVEEELHIRRLARNMGLGECLVWCGVLPHRRLPAYYQAADVLIVPSRSESFGLVAAEAQGVGLPVVAANVGGLRYVVKEGVSGFLVDGWDPPDYAKAVLKVLEGGAERDRLVEGALESGRRFGWETATGRLMELYRGIV